MNCKRRLHLTLYLWFHLVCLSTLGRLPYVLVLNWSYLFVGLLVLVQDGDYLHFLQSSDSFTCEVTCRWRLNLALYSSIHGVYLISLGRLVYLLAGLTILVYDCVYLHLQVSSSSLLEVTCRWKLNLTLYLSIHGVHFTPLGRLTCW